MQGIARQWRSQSLTSCAVFPKEIQHFLSAPESR